MHSMVFYFDGICSSDYDIYLVSKDGGLHTSPFLAERDLQTESIPNNDTPYLYGVKRNPLKKKLVFGCFDDEWTFDKRRQIANWLDKDYFCEFYTESDPEKRYYFMYTGGIDLTYDGSLKGYIEVDFVNISPYTYSPEHNEQFTINQVNQEIVLWNDGDNPIYPEMTITKVGDGDLSIINTSNVNGKEFKFTGLLTDEVLTVSNQYHEIETNLSNTLRYDNFNHNYLELKTGKNTLKINGNCELEIKYMCEFKG